MVDALEETYNLIPYSSEPIAASHPAHLAAIAYLMGLNPVTPSKARILELGCAKGDNILSIAGELPESTCVGIDLSPQQISAGQELLKKSGIKNLTLERRNILELDSSFGTFDYIIIHGMFSWVSKQVQDKILQICGECLSSEGIAYISYNTFPGWHVRSAIREMMLFEAKTESSLALRATRSRRILEFMAKSVNKNTPYGALMLEELRHPLNMPDWYLTHDFIAEYNDPQHFYQFMERCEQHGMQYVGDSEVPMMFPHDLSPQVQQQLSQLTSSVIEREQYTDFVRNRMFRRSILSRSSNAVRSTFDQIRVSSLYLASPLTPPTAGSADPLFRHPNGGAIRSPDGALTVALQLLKQRWPGSTHFTELFPEVCTRSPNRERTEIERVLRQTILTCYSAALLELSLEPRQK